MTLVGLIGEQINPVGKGVSDSCTEPVNPFTGVMVIVEVVV